MATLRKRIWGKSRSAWVGTYTDQQGARHQKTFRTKREADDWMVEARHQISRGTHLPDSTSPSVADAARRWLNSAEARGLERSTLEQYQQHIARIVAELGQEKLSRLTEERVEDFRDRLLRTISRPLAAKIMVTLRSILRRAKRPMDIRIERHAQGRHQERLEIGRDIPTPAEIRGLLASSTAPARGILALAALAGLRASEIRGLRWSDLDLAQRTVTIRQRADRWGQIGSPKSKEARRTVPLGPEAVRILKEHKLAGRPGIDLVFANSVGKPYLLGNLRKRVIAPALAAAGLRGYGLHSFRHFFASWQLSQGVPLKILQHRMGHSSILLTSDRYGHLMPETADDRARADAAERALLA